LRRLNEVEIAVADFPNALGVQALVKDSVKASIAKINQSEFEWPFNAAEHTQLLVAGQTEYTWPDFFKISDWNSFQLQGNETLGVGFSSLKHMDRDEWYKTYRDNDYDAGAAGIGAPRAVFSSHGNGFGVTPAPDAAYSIRFRYYLNYSDLTNHNDTTRIPTSFDTVITDGAMYHMYMFKDNMDASQTSFMAYTQGVKDLQTLYINSYDYIRDTRVNR